MKKQPTFRIEEDILKTIENICAKNNIKSKGNYIEELVLNDQNKSKTKSLDEDLSSKIDRLILVVEDNNTQIKIAYKMLDILLRNLQETKDNKNEIDLSKIHPYTKKAKNNIISNKIKQKNNKKNIDN